MASLSFSNPHAKASSASAPAPSPTVLLSADKVTFTVQSEIAVSNHKGDERSTHRPGFTSKVLEFLVPGQQSESREAQWLSIFTRCLTQNERQTRRNTDPAATPPAVQAFYHSSVLPLPRTSGGLGPISNGLVSACLVSFTEVTHAGSFVRVVLMPLLQHRRLVLRPDDIFLPLLDAAATHVFQNGEASRNVFVGHSGKKV
jgi:hypothetical protein